MEDAKLWHKQLVPYLELIQSSSVTHVAVLDRAAEQRNNGTPAATWTTGSPVWGYVASATASRNRGQA